MAREELDDDGLPKAGTRNPEGMFNARFDEETWAMIRQLEAVWEKEKGVRLNGKDVVRSCIVRTYKAKLAELEVEHKNDLPDLPLTPIEQYEAQQTVKPKKKRYVRKS